ncbi:MAG: hypothetical protein QE285_19205 [Aquabacterium sp.]|nr:hypothetical protein [Aquabacterium sp.]
MTDARNVDIQALFAEQFQASMHGICFSADPQGQHAGDQLLAADVGRRIDLIAPHTRWVRSFSCTEGHAAIPRLARAKCLKTLVGAWTSQDRARNEREIAALCGRLRRAAAQLRPVLGRRPHRPCSPVPALHARPGEGCCRRGQAGVISETGRPGWFSSFDAPWKLKQEIEMGIQWGLRDKDEHPKYRAVET